MDLIAILWCSGALHVVRHKTIVGGLEIKYDGHMFVSGEFSENVISRRAGKITTPKCKNHTF